MGNYNSKQTKKTPERKEFQEIRGKLLQYLSMASKHASNEWKTGNKNIVISYILINCSSEIINNLYNDAIQDGEYSKTIKQHNKIIKCLDYIKTKI